jgi:hypothetical protein
LPSKLVLRVVHCLRRYCCRSVSGDSIVHEAGFSEPVAPSGAGGLELNHQR